MKRVLNFTRAVVVSNSGGLTLSSVAGYPTPANTLTVNEEFVVAFTDENYKPIAVGVGKFTAFSGNNFSFSWVSVEETYVGGVSDLTSPATPTIPVNAIMHTPLSADVLSGLAEKSANKFTGLQSFANAVTVASAATLNLTTANSNNIIISGTTSVTTVSMPEGAEITARFTGAVPFVNSANLVLPNGKNATARVGDIVKFIRIGTVVYLIVLQKAPSEWTAVSRSFATTYTNTRLYDLEVTASAYSNFPPMSLSLFVNGSQVTSTSANATEVVNITLSIPSGSTYYWDNPGLNAAVFTTAER